MRIWRECNGCNRVLTYFGKHAASSGAQHTPGAIVRWDEPTDYRAMHRLLALLRGRASDSPCASCGDTERKHEWALREDLHERGGKAWSPEVGDYSALCKPCHARRDIDPNFAAAHVVEQRRRADAAFDEEMHGKRARAGSVGGSASAQNRAARRAEDTEYDEWLHGVLAENGRKVGLVVSSRRRRCAHRGCTFPPNNPANIGKHQKHSGHEGWVEL